MHILSPAPTAVALLLAVPLWLVACHEGSDPRNLAAAANAASPMAQDQTDALGSVAPVAVNNSVGISIVDSHATPAAAAKAMRGEKGARAVLLDWSDALEKGDWAAARAQWGHDGADSGLNPAAFARSYAPYRSITVSIGDGDVEGAAGSLYYQVPVTIGGTLKTGRPFSLEGTVTVRRVNDVDGSSAADRAWHISASDLKPRR